MMLAQEIPPTEIGKHANIIKAAQEDLANMDVLVCGRCLRAFHFVEEFQVHKEDSCEKENANVKETLDLRSRIWAFSLWKITQLQTRKDVNSINSWALYQHWSKLDDSVREPWVVAGKTIQSFGKISHGELQDMPVRITKTVVNPTNNNNNNSSTANSNTVSSVSPTRKSITAGAKQSIIVAQLKDTENERPKSKPGTPTPIAAGSSTGNAAKSLNRLALRTDPQSKKRQEESVEKIVAKRFNPRAKTHEYLVKWLDRNHVENTWEPTANLERVPYYLQLFEKQLARQKLTREKSMDSIKRLQTSKGELANTPAANSTSSAVTSTPGSGTRPPRTSKTKAMDQVKQWVSEGGAGGGGSLSPTSNNDDETGENTWSTSPAHKRKLNNADNSLDGGINASNDSMMEDLEEDLPSHKVKRLKNGEGISLDSNKGKFPLGEKTAAKVNGNAALSAPVIKMAELIYTDDVTATGLMRKPDIPSSLHSKKEKHEGIVRHLTKAEMQISTTGIVRLEQQMNADNLKVSSTPHLITTKRVAATKTTRSSAVNSPVTITQRTQVVRPPGQLPVQRRAATLRTSQTPIRVGTTTGTPTMNRMLLTRSNTPQRQQPTVTGKAITPEQKILQLSRSGDLKVTRKLMTRDELLSQRAAQQQQRQQRQQQQVQIQKVQQVSQSTPARMRTAGGAIATSVGVKTATAMSTPTAMQVEVEDEMHQAQLCPITGKLIGQEESQLQMEKEQQQEQQREQLEAAAQALLGSTGEQQVLTNEDGTALLVRGEDGTVYQVAGKNAQGQTILVTQGPDGEQQFAYVASVDGEDQDVLSLDNAVAEAVAHLPEQQSEALSAGAAGTGDGEQILVSMTEEELAQHQAAVLQQAAAAEETTTSVAPTTQLQITTSDSDGTEANIPAEVVQADLPSPGGTRRVVLLLQDGTFMMTEMHEDQFKTLNIPT